MADLNEFFDEVERDFARAKRLVIGGLATILAAILIACILTTAQAAPRVGSGEECVAYADLAVTARALAVEKVDRERADRIVALMYVADNDRARELMRAITAAAYQGSGTPLEFAQKFYVTCMAKAGNIDDFLGQPT